MRWSQLAQREIINLWNGHRLGPIGQADLLVDEASGRIEELLVPPHQGIWRARRSVVIPWQAVRRVGPEVIIVEIEPTDGRERSSSREKN